MEPKQNKYMMGQYSKKYIESKYLLQDQFHEHKSRRQHVKQYSQPVQIHELNYKIYHNLQQIQ